MRSIGLLKLLSSLAGCDITFQPESSQYAPETPDAGGGDEVVVARDAGDAAEVSVEEDATTRDDVPVREDVPVDEDVPVQEDAGSDVAPDAGAPVSISLLSPLRGAVMSEEDQYVFTGRLDNAPGHGPIQCGFVFFREDQKNAVGNLATVTSPETDGDEVTARLDGDRLEPFQRFCWGIAACADQTDILWVESVYEEGNHLCATALDRGTVHFWDFDIRENFIVPDLAGEANDGQIHPALPGENEFVAGAFGDALRLDSDSEYVDTHSLNPEGRPIGFGNTWTIIVEMMLELNGLQTFLSIGRKRVGPLPNYLEFLTNGTDIFMNYYDREGNLAQHRSEQGVLETGEWVQLAFTRDEAGDVHFYKNGASLESGNVGEGELGERIDDPFSQIELGREMQDRRNTRGAFAGLLIYNRALDPDAVQALFDRRFIREE